jgi:concanavalin A-like lectin/glucanase superfamily protein
MRVRTRSTLAAAFAAAALIALPATAGAAGFPLVGWWPMNEGSGQVVHDYSGHRNNGQLGETPGADDHDPSWIPGVFAGSALRFGGDDYVQIPDSTSLEPSKLTVAAWVRGTSSPGPFRYVVAKGATDCASGSYGLYTGDNGGLAFYIGDGTQTYSRSPQAPASVWDGKWHHVAGTFDGTTVRLFVDGQQVGSGTPAINALSYAPAGGGFIGDFHGSCDLYLVGDVDGVQVWSQALPIDDIWRFLKALFSTSR